MYDKNNFSKFIMLIIGSRGIVSDNNMCCKCKLCTKLNDETYCTSCLEISLFKVLGITGEYCSLCDTN
jgi:hypothetical protein